MMQNMRCDYQQIGPDEQRLYDHFLALVQSESPEYLIECVRHLFVEGVDYGDSAIINSLDRIITSPSVNQEFRFVLNRCLHILTNRWQNRPQAISAISKLLQTLETGPTRPIIHHPRIKILKQQRALIRNFVQTEQYAALQRLAVVLTQEPDESVTQPLRCLIRRYPYLYPHCLVSEGCSAEDERSVRSLQLQMQHDFEMDLSRYVTYQVRQVALSGRISGHRPTQTIVQPPKNPTLLSEGEISAALRHFAGKANGGYSQRDLAQQFLTYSQGTPRLGDFKDDLYEYLISAIDPEYGRRQFNQQLYRQLQNTLSEQNHCAPNDFLILRLCSQLINFLVVESAQSPKHYIFADLISNLGPTLTTGLLLKILLICRKVRPHLEKRLSILFNHYESYTRDSVEWLVMVMENLNLALTTNFGNINLAFVHFI
jgi:hypothetical protein